MSGVGRGCSNTLTRKKDEPRTCENPNCENTLSKVTKGNQCRKCYTNPSVKPDTFLSSFTEHLDALIGHTPKVVDENSKVGDLCVSDFRDIIKEEIKFIANGMKEVIQQVENLQKTIKEIKDKQSKQEEQVATNGKDLSSLKKVIVEQQKYLEIVKKKELSNNIIVSGIPNDAFMLGDAEVNDDNGKLEAIFHHIDCLEVLSSSHKVISIPMREGAKAHSVKMQFEDKSYVRTIMEKAKTLKSFEAAKIYINYDEPYYSRKEHNRLRKEKFNLLASNPEDDIKIQKGKLCHNNLVVDQFDLSNQLF